MLACHSCSVSFWSDYAPDIITGILGGGFTLLAVYLGVRWSMQKYTAQKMWETRAQKYNEILDHLIKISRIMHKILILLNSKKELNDEEKKKAENTRARLADSFISSGDEMLPILRKGRAFVSEEAAEILENLIDEMSKDENNVEGLEWGSDEFSEIMTEMLKAIDETISMINDCVKKEIPYS